MAQEQSKTAGVAIGSNSAVSVAAGGDTDLLELPVDGLEQLFIEIAVTVQALDAFIFLGKIHPDSAYVVLSNAITATPGGLVVAASGALATQAAGTTGWAALSVKGLSAVKFQASANVAGAATVTIRARGSQ